MVAVPCMEVPSPTSSLAVPTGQVVVLAKRGISQGHLVLATVLPIAFVVFTVPWIIRCIYLKYTGQRWIGCLQPEPDDESTSPTTARESEDDKSELVLEKEKEAYPAGKPMAAKKPDQAQVGGAPPVYERDVPATYHGQFGK